MRIIKYIQLYKYLLEEDNSPIGAYKVIQSIRKLPVELKNAVFDILNGSIPFIEYHDVSLQELLEKDNMKPIRAILMLDWIRREPLVAMRYMAREKLNAPLMIDDNTKQMLLDGKKIFNTKHLDEAKQNVSDITEN